MDNERAKREGAAHAVVEEPHREIWARLVHRDTHATGPSLEGCSLAEGAWRVCIFHAMGAAVMFMLLMIVTGAVASVQIDALGLDNPDESSDLTRSVVIAVVGFIASLGQYALAVGAVVGAGVFALRMHERMRLRCLKQVWWSLPLSPWGRTQVEQVVSELPILRPFFLQPGKEDLTQADLAFARQASKALRHVVRHQHTLEEVAAREQALESLPSMAKYRARQLARSMEESLPDGTASKPSSRL